MAQFDPNLAYLITSAINEDFVVTLAPSDPFSKGDSPIIGATNASPKYLWRFIPQAQSHGTPYYAQLANNSSKFLLAKDGKLWLSSSKTTVFKRSEAGSINGHDVYTISGGEGHLRLEKDNDQVTIVKDAEAGANDKFYFDEFAA